MISFQGAVDQTDVLWSAFHTPSSSCSIISSVRTWHLVKLQGSAESETWSIKKVHICTASLSWTHLVSPVNAEPFRMSPAVGADTPHVLTRGGHDISTAVISRDAHSWLWDEGICWRFLTDCDRIQGVWRIDAVEENWLGYPSVSAGEYQRAPLIFHLSSSLDIFIEHIHYFLMLKVTTLDSVCCEALSKISGDWQ